MAVTQVTKDNFKQEVLDYKGAVLVDFYADWCGPCKVTSPIVDELSNEIKEMKFVKINVDENSELAATYQVFSIPNFVIFNQGVVANQFLGAMPKEAFLTEIKKITS